MRKLLLIPAALVLSTGFAFAMDGVGGGGGGAASPSITQSWTANPSITNLTKAHAFVGSFGRQTAAVVGNGSISQTVTASPTINNITQGHVTVITNVHQLAAIVP